MNLKFKIKGLDCANCALELERVISRMEEIESVSINFMSERIIIVTNESNKDEIMKRVIKVVKKVEPDVTLEEV